uniref:Tubulin tyrosine ligase n=1 Tax=Macrostomum lignano TaxID=282301 RepID=A0A1I8IPI3_9PLAT
SPVCGTTAHLSSQEDASSVPVVIAFGRDEGAAEPLTRLSTGRNRPMAGKTPRSSRGASGRRTCSCYLATQYGAKIIREVMRRLNWPEAADSAILSSPQTQQPKAAPPLTLIWCNGCQADLFIRKMRPGQHIISRLPGTRCLTNKLLLPETLRAQDAAPQCRCRDHPRLTADAVLPATFVLRTAMQRLQFLRRMSSESGSLWICKPATLNRGEGIKLVRAELDFRNLFNDERTNGEPRRDWVIQKYIERPLLLAGKKFDLRVYLLVLATLNLNCLAFYHPGYARLTCRDFDLKSDDLCLHLTNQAVQQKDSAYDAAREETIWSIDRLNCHINEHCEQLGLDKDFAISGMQVSIRQALAHLVAATRPKLATACGCFELFGCDFLVEESGKIATPAPLRTVVDCHSGTSTPDSSRLPLRHFHSGLPLGTSPPAISPPPFPFRRFPSNIPFHCFLSGASSLITMPINGPKTGAEPTAQRRIWKACDQRFRRLAAAYQHAWLEVPGHFHFHVWLLELNSTPALGLYNSTQEAIIPGVVHEALAIAAEAFDRVFRRQPVLPLSGQQKEFQLIYDSSSRPRQPRPTLVERQQKAGQLSSRTRSMPALNLHANSGISSAKSSENLHLSRPSTASSSNSQPQQLQKQQTQQTLPQRQQRGAVAVRLQKAKSSLSLSQTKPSSASQAAVVKSIGKF